MRDGVHAAMTFCSCVTRPDWVCAVLQRKHRETAFEGAQWARRAVRTCTSRRAGAAADVCCDVRVFAVSASILPTRVRAWVFGGSELTPPGGPLTSPRGLHWYGWKPGNRSSPPRTGKMSCFRSRDAAAEGEGSRRGHVEWARTHATDQEHQTSTIYIINRPPRTRTCRSARARRRPTWTARSSPAAPTRPRRSA